MTQDELRTLYAKIDDVYAQEIKVFGVETGVYPLVLTWHEYDCIRHLVAETINE